MDKAAQPLDYMVEHALKEEVAPLVVRVTEGKADDWGEYKYLCGQIRGIQFAMDCLKGARGKAGLDGDLE